MTAIELANIFAVRHIIQKYLSPERGNQDCLVEGMHITSRRTWNRYGVPADASSWRISIQHTEQKWSVTVRAVFLDGKFLQPAATHTTFEDYWADDADLIADEDAAQIRINKCLRTVPL